MSLISGFQPNCEVTDTRFLFGHHHPSHLLDRLITQLQLGANIQLLGERRSGKTSILKCLASRLKTDCSELIPVYLNYREHSSIKGQGAAYKFMMANIHATIVREGKFEGVPTVSIRGIELDNDTLPETTYEALESVPDYRIGGIIEDYLHILSERGLGIILLIDEYEHLMRNTFEGNGGAFFLIRTLSSQPSLLATSPKPFTYLIAGVFPWDQLCNLMGSPELNNTGPVFYIEPLNNKSFQEMWKHCLGISSSAFQEQVENNNIELEALHELVGGWAFYGKLAGQYLGSSIFSENELYDSLMQHFNVVWSHMSTQERATLFSSEKGGSLSDDPFARTLIQRGLLEASPTGITKLRGNLWARYVREQKLEAASSQSNPSLLTGVDGKLILMADEVAVLVTEINETSMNLGRGEIFNCSNQDVQIYHDLRRPGINADEFSHFALSLYNLLFERTTKVKMVKTVASSGKSIEDKQQFRALETLPNQFRRNNIAIRIADSVRHHFGKGHLTRLESFNASGNGMDISEVLQRYLHTKAHPLDRQFIELQTGILGDVIDYLTKLRSHLQKDADLQKTQLASLSDC